MLSFLLGCMLGGTVGFMICALLVVAKEKEVKEECTITMDPIIDYKCRGAYGDWCGNTCCFTCSIATECTKPYKCNNHPSTCGLSVRGELV